MSETTFREEAAKALWEEQNPLAAMDEDGGWDALHDELKAVARHDVDAVLRVVASQPVTDALEQLLAALECSPVWLNGWADAPEVLHARAVLGAARTAKAQDDLRPSTARLDGSSSPHRTETPRLNPLACNEQSETGLVCGMQKAHGGLMHAGGNPLKWWTRDSKMVDFAARTETPQ